MTSPRKPSIAMRPFHRSALDVNGPKLRASVDSPLMMGTSDAYVNSCTAPRKYNSPSWPAFVTCSNTVCPVILSTTTAHTNPSIAYTYTHMGRGLTMLMVSGAAPSNANTLKKFLLPVSGLLSTSGRGYNDPDVGSVPNTDFFSDSLVSWLRRMSSLVMVVFVCRSTTALASASGPSPLPASQRTLPASEVGCSWDKRTGPSVRSARPSVKGQGRSV
ncbi:hypothetical protein M758_2G060000 [Ceratodon purpureus]|nr:hypothetical protein M758_2G060000 [Ceratodon purpureus]